MAYLLYTNYNEHWCMKHASLLRRKIWLINTEVSSEFLYLFFPHPSEATSFLNFCIYLYINIFHALSLRICLCCFGNLTFKRMILCSLNSFAICFGFWRKQYYIYENESSCYMSLWFTNFYCTVIVDMNLSFSPSDENFYFYN